MKKRNVEELIRRIPLGEGIGLELKESGTPATIGPIICAFLNSGGGYIAIGVAGSNELIGAPADTEIRSLEEAVTGKLTPKATVFFETIEIENKLLWLIEVPSGPDVPYAYDNQIYLRRGAANTLADLEAIREMILRRQVEPERWERQFSDANPDTDIDLREVRVFLARAGKAGRHLRHSEQEEQPLSLLMHLGLIKYGRITNGGDVLFSYDPSIRFPQARVRAAAFLKDKTDDTFRDLKAFSGPVGRVIEQLHGFIKQNTPSMSSFRPGQLAREQQMAYPELAVREALVNAFAHRDYADYRGGVTVHIYPNRLEVWNSGSLPEGITPEILANQGHLSILRNPDIAQVLYLMGFMEKAGRGCLLIRRELQERGMRPPAWQSDRAGVTLTIYAPEVTPQVTPEVTPEVTPQVEAVLTAINGQMSRRALQERLNLSDEKHFRKKYLQPAVDAGLIAMTIPDKPTSRSQRYCITKRGSDFLQRRGSPRNARKEKE